MNKIYRCEKAQFVEEVPGQVGVDQGIHGWKSRAAGETAGRACGGQIHATVKTNCHAVHAVQIN